MSRARRILSFAALAMVLVVAALAAAVIVLNRRGEPPLDPARRVDATPALVARGATLARAGNCIGCHTAPGGALLAGGRGIETPFGVVHAPNLTPDEATGLGAWSADEFARALRHGRSRDGRLLYPAFPYPSYTLLTQEDSDALYAWVRSLPPVRQPARAHELRFPFNTQAALAVWRALYFRPGSFAPDPGQDAAWNRGRYLVQGLGHCAACHSPRNLLGATRLNTEFGGGLMPGEGWYAPSLASPREAGVQGWPREEVVRLLRHGMTPRASVAGPMAEVVATSLQHLPPADIDAMARYLASIPVREPQAPTFEAAPAEVMERGTRLYEQHCVACHGDRGQGVSGIYPALAGNRAVTLGSPNNLVQVIRWGGFAPSTAGNPRPFGMPPFGQVLSEADIAALATALRQSWGHRASAVTPLQVHQVK